MIFTVTTIDDEMFNGGTLEQEAADGTGLSLREAVLLANATAGADEVAFDESLLDSTIRLTLGTQITIGDDLTIRAPTITSTAEMSAFFNLVQVPRLGITGDVNDDDDGSFAFGLDISESPGMNFADNTRVFGITPGNEVSISGLAITGGNNVVGGGIAAFDSTLHLDGVFLAGNYGVDGGGLYFSGAGAPDILTIDETLLLNNLATSDGGAIALRNAEDGGGAITDTLLFGNDSEDTGGAISSVSSTLSLNRAYMLGNQADNSGGGIDALGPGGSVSIDASYIVGNSTDSMFMTGRGGAIATSVPTTVTSTLFVYNGSDYGAGVWNNGNGLNIANSYFRLNMAAVEGGAIWNSVLTRVVNTTVVRNLSESTGGGIFNDTNPSAVLLVNSTVGENVAMNGGGIVNEGGLRLVNSTVAGNVANNGASGIVNQDITILANSIVSGNAEFTYGQFSGVDGVVGGFTEAGPNIVGQMFYNNGPQGMAPPQTVFGYGTDQGLPLGFSNFIPILTDNPGLSIGPPNNQVQLPTASLALDTANPAIGSGDPSATTFINETDFGIDFNGDGDANDAVPTIADFANDQRGPGFVRIAPFGPDAPPLLDLGAVEAIRPNAPPDAVPDVFFFDAPGILPVTLPVLENDTDPDGDPISISEVQATGLFGGLVQAPDGSLIYDIPQDLLEALEGEVVVDTFTYTITDGGLSDTASVTVTTIPDAVLPAGDLPDITARNDRAETAETAGDLVIDLFGNDSLPPGFRPLLDIDTTGLDGEIEERLPDGRVIYRPGPEALGLGRDEILRDSFVYSVTISDSQGNTRTDAARVEIEIIGENDPVRALDSTKFLVAGESGFIRPTVADSDPGDDLLITQLGLVDQGMASVAVGPAQLIFFDTGEDFDDLLPGETREESFDYLATDGLTTDTGTITVVVIGAPGAEVIRPGDGAFAVESLAAPRTIVAHSAPEAEVSLPLALADLTVAPTADGFVLTPAGGAPVTLFSVETVQLEDATLTLDDSAVTKTLWRFYEAFLGRGGDPLGLGHWKAAHDRGMSLSEIAERFAASEELALALAGDGSDEAYVAQLYAFALDRECDPAGCAHWVGRLAEGSLSRAELGIALAASEEMVEATYEMLDDGILIA